MWFKHLQIYQFSSDFIFNIEDLTNKLESKKFHSCANILPMSMGWEAPIGKNEDAPLVHAANGSWLIRLKIEEKLLPATVIRNHTNEKINTLETEQKRKLSSKEKAAIRDETYGALLPQAFSKYSHINALIDPEKRLLIIDSSSRSKAEDYITFMRKAVETLPVTLLDTLPISQILTKWLQLSTLPIELQLGGTCVLQDSKAEGGIVRCSKQDLRSPNIQAFLQDNMEVAQIQLAWKTAFNLHLT